MTSLLLIKEDSLWQEANAKFSSYTLEVFLEEGKSSHVMTWTALSE